MTDESQKFAPVCQRPFVLQIYGILPESGGKGKVLERKESSWGIIVKDRTLFEMIWIRNGIDFLLK